MNIFSYWQDFYNDPWFWQFPMATLAFSMADFLTVAIPWTVIAWNPAHLFPVYEGPVYHDFHHAKFKGNYTGFLSYLDKYLGKTHIPAYLCYLKAKKTGLTPVEIEEQEKKSKR